MTMQQRIRTAPAVILAGMLLLVMCPPQAKAQEATGSVRLRVESHGTPLAGAEVRRPRG
jgi:hypothetical protein